MNKKVDAWEPHWEKKYSLGDKRKYLLPVMKKYDLGNRIVDVGSGHHPVTGFIDTLKEREAHPERKVIVLDIVWDENETLTNLRVRFDIEDLLDATKISTRDVLSKWASFFGVDCQNPQDKRKVTAIIFSEILNYVDTRNTLRSCFEYLESGGIFVIANHPTRGEEKNFSPNKLKSNNDLVDFLKEVLWCEILEKVFPNGWADEDQDLMLLVVRKREY